MTTLTATPHIPVLRLGKPYRSLDSLPVRDCRTGEAIAHISVANAGLVRRDLRQTRVARQALARFSCEELIDLCARAGDKFLHAELALGDMGPDDDAPFTQTPEDYVRTLAATSGLPHVMVRRNMAKVHTVLTGMRGILNGLTRGLDLSVIDRGVGEQAGVSVSFHPTTDALGCVLPSNSPGVNSIWLPAIALKTPVILKPGREEPWTPMRLIAALVDAGLPPEAIGFYPTDHDGADAVMTGCGRAIIFGDDRTLSRYAGNPAVNLHGTGRSKIILGDDCADRWRDYLDLIVSSVADNGGRSCINASTILTPRHADDLADALARELAAIRPRDADDPEARLSAFANPAFAHAIDQQIDDLLAQPGARDVTAAHRPGPRCVRHQDAVYLLPAVVRCDSIDHPLANTEYLFPFVSVVEMPIDAMVSRMGPSLVVTALTDDEDLRQELTESPDVDRLNLGPIATSHVSWDQPHEGNLFEFLYRRRAIARA